MARGHQNNISSASYCCPDELSISFVSILLLFIVAVANVVEFFLAFRSLDNFIDATECVLEGGCIVLFFIVFAIFEYFFKDGADIFADLEA